jgi:hypothetical protein
MTDSAKRNGLQNFTPYFALLQEVSGQENCRRKGESETNAL